MGSLFKTLFRDGRSIPIGIKLIVLVIFLRALGWGFADPLFPLYLNQFSEEYSVVGSLVSIMQIGSFLMLIPLIRLGDRVKDGTIIQDGEMVYFFVILCYVLAGIFHSLPLLILGLFLNGVGQPLIVDGAESYIRRHDPGSKSAPFGFYVAMDNFGWVLGMVIGAFLIRYYSLNTMFLWVLPSIFLSFFILPRVHERGIRSFFQGFRKYFHRKEDFLGIIADAKALNPKVFFFLLLAFFDGVLRMFSFTFIPLFGLSMNLSMGSISLLMAVMYLPFVFSFFFSELEDRLPRMNMIALGLFIAALSYGLLFLIVQQASLILLIAMTSFSMAIIRPAYQGAITRLTLRSQSGEITAFHNLVERLGRISGPLVTGFVADVYGLKTTFLAVGIAAFALGILSLCLRGYNTIVAAEAS
ncbi:MAG: MFS transporter [Candidatus Peregrinibacteria bacterium]